MVTDMTLSFQNGLVIYAIIHRYRRDLIDFASLDPKDIAAVNNQLAFNLLECELDISPITTGQEMAGAEIIGQLLASAVTQRKKRRSAENEVREDDAQDENRYSRVSNKKRLAKLMERAAMQEKKSKETADPKNIKSRELSSSFESQSMYFPYRIVLRTRNIVSYLLQVNQDALENLFSLLR